VAGGGGGAAPTYPGLVNSRLERTGKALDRAVDYADDGQPDKAVSSLYTARLQVKLAWRAAKYVIQHAPPPVVGGDDVRARVSGGARPAERSPTSTRPPVPCSTSSTASPRPRSA
jgi:hypothetical protein